MLRSRPAAQPPTVFPVNAESWPGRVCRTRASVAALLRSGSATRALAHRRRVRRLYAELERAASTSAARLAVGGVVLARTAFPASPFRSISRTRGSSGSSGASCAKRRAAIRAGSCASCATRPVTRSTTPTGCAAASAGARCSGRPRCSIPQRYRARPGSRRYVHHLGEWYAQAHPTEDFAETFAVWLKPRSGWRKSYAEWPAFHKLQHRR